MIIGLAGVRRSGKDTVGAYLVKNYGFKRIAFADKLKDSVAALLDIPRWDVDKYKLDSDVHVAIGYINRPDENPSPLAAVWSSVRSMTFREFLARYGTEAHRDIFSKNFWIEQALPAGIYAGRKIVVTDVRFQEEVDQINDIGGIVVRVRRPEVEKEISNHSSETNVFVLRDIGHEIMNDGTVEELFAKTEDFLYGSATNTESNL